jgi:hypothetical protein
MTASRRRQPRRGLETVPPEFAAAFSECDAAAIASLRAREYARFDAGGHVYLDYTGASLYAESQLRGA